MPKYALSSDFQMQPGFLEVEAASMVYVLMIKSLGPWQCGRLGPPCASKCAPEASQLGLSRARLAPFFGFRTILTAVFCSLQLPSSTVVPVVLHGVVSVGLASGEMPFLPFDPFWTPKNPM